MYEWGIKNRGCTLHIDTPYVFELSKPIVIDVETNESDSFVGIGVTQDGIDIYYYTSLRDDIKSALEAYWLVGHNLKFDFHLLVKWGVKLKYEQIVDDTQLMAYVQDSTQDTGLKDLGKKYLNIEYPTYKEIVGKGKDKKTLDKQDVELVANYCAMDVYTTLKLKEYLTKNMVKSQFEYYRNIEMPTCRILTEMEDKKIYLDVPKLKKLDTELDVEIKGHLAKHLTATHKNKKGIEEPINWRSPKQVLEWLRINNINVKSTGSEVLEYYKSDPKVTALLKYRELFKLYSTYTQSLLALEHLPWSETNFNQTVTVTGRLSSSNPINWQNIPRSEDNPWGTKLRACFSAPEGYQFISSDFDQIEYRLLAHFTQEPVLLESFRQGKDIHQQTADLIGTSRMVAKTCNFCAIYGGQAKKVAYITGTSEDQAVEFLKKYWDKLPLVRVWMERAKFNAKKLNGIQTLYGRFIPIRGLWDGDKFIRMSAERQVISYTIQGSAAEVLKASMMSLKEFGYVANLTVHDELNFIRKESEYLDDEIQTIKDLMEQSVKLSIPLTTTIGKGANWTQAKG